MVSSRVSSCHTEIHIFQSLNEVCLSSIFSKNKNEKKMTPAVGETAQNARIKEVKYHKSLKFQFHQIANEKLKVRCFDKPF